MSFKYAVVLSNLEDPGGSSETRSKGNRGAIAMLEVAASIPHVTGVELTGNWDIRPDNAAEIRLALEALELTCVSIIPDLSADPRWDFGSLSAPDASTRGAALSHIREMCNVARTVGCGLINLTLGRDGTDYLLTRNYEAQRNWLIDGIRLVAEENPDLQFALDLREMGQTADALLLCVQSGQKNVGVCIDTGHSLASGVSTGEAIVLARAVGGRLLHLRFSENFGPGAVGLIIGTVHHTEFIEALYWLDRTGYGGWLSIDQLPGRANPGEALVESVHTLQSIAQIVANKREEIDNLVEIQDPIMTSRFIRKITFAGGG